jgi:ArsR family transcriptional regulator
MLAHFRKRAIIKSMKRASMPKRCIAALEAQLDPTVFRALGDPQRLALLARIATAPQPLTVTEASQCCGIHLSGASRHLAQLRDAGVLVGSKSGREVVYRVNVRALAQTLRGLADALEQCCGQSNDSHEQQST